VEKYFLAHNIAPQIPMPEKWNVIKTLLYFSKCLPVSVLQKNNKARLSV